MKNLYCRFCFDSSAAIVASPKGSIRGKFKTRNKIGSKDFFKHVSNINLTLVIFRKIFENLKTNFTNHVYSRFVFWFYENNMNTEQRGIKRIELIDIASLFQF